MRGVAVFACVDAGLFIHRLIVTVHLGFIGIHRSRSIQARSYTAA